LQKPSRSSRPGRFNYMRRKNINKSLKIAIFYFSGTGNTAWAVNQLAEKLLKLDYEVKLLSCEEDFDISLEIDKCDIVGIAFPIHSSFAPKIMQDCLNKFPVDNKKPLIGLVTAGYMAGDVLWYETAPLRKKGYIPRVFCNIRIGNNMHLPKLSPLPVTKPEKLATKLEKADRKIEQMAHYIHEEILHIEGHNLPGKLLGVVQRLVAEKFESVAFTGFYADQTCNRCGLCVSNCPANNIYMEDHEIKFDDNCILCMRCYSYCPNQAIQLNEKTKNTKKYQRYKGPGSEMFKL